MTANAFRKDTVFVVHGDHANRAHHQADLMSRNPKTVETFHLISQKRNNAQAKASESLQNTLRGSSNHETDGLKGDEHQPLEAESKTETSSGRHS